MSGHSKWSTIKHKKEAKDAKRSKQFSKISTLITHAAKSGGGDADMNPTLRMHIDKAKSIGFPIDNIEKAIAKGTGEEMEGLRFEEVSYEGFGPSGVAIIVDCLTDNINRTVSEIRRLFEDVGGSLGESGSVSWNFDIKGKIDIKAGHKEKSEKFGEEDKFVPDNRDDVMIELMDIEGILDIHEKDIDGVKGLEVITEFRDMMRIRDDIASKFPYIIDDVSIIKIPNNKKKLEGEDLEKVQRALERFEDHNDVQMVWSELDV
ncbi:MAG: YebC/PmpR family DNA-binding transcriptional regulator [Candidatus Dojkabacteria bacterium]|jgi:YebC/PmpR family DNA-binding regulatory protein|nr:YebC/PmpR family DNA-binding transcriptional regulator [Candidatus Dojkabacteria bacterium]